MKTFYPEIEPYATHCLAVTPPHSLYIEEVGNPNGLPVVFLHGGPGGGISTQHRRLFNPALYRIILFDQRGSGQSTPHAHLEHNTTWDSVEDMEHIRQQLGIETWLVFGGSWGSTLALAYAETHPERTAGLILRGIFLCRPEEIEWFYQSGCHQIYPDRWEAFCAPIATTDRHEMVNAYYRLLTGPDEAARLKAAQAWSVWEGSTVKLVPNIDVIADFEDPMKALAMARIECHYFVHHSFLKTPAETHGLGQLLADAGRLANIPMWIVHGRYDVVCPAKNAWDLKHACPHAHLSIVPDAGHAFDEPGILHELISATDTYAEQALALQH